jgi:hypothetical protein
MIAGRGTPDQAPAHKLREEDPETFGALMDLLTEATIEYLDQQVQAGAEVVKIFDSWAGSLKGEAFDRFALEPARRITAELKRRHPGLPVIAFPREAGEKLHRFRQGRWRRLAGHRHQGRSRMGGGAPATRRLRAGQPRPQAHDHRRRGLVRRPADRRCAEGRAAYLQPRPRHHAGGRPGERAPASGRRFLRD